MPTNPAVNPQVISDFSSNADGRRYASTTDDLLDRIRSSVDQIIGNPGGGNPPMIPDYQLQVKEVWIVLDMGGAKVSGLVNVLFKVKETSAEILGIIIDDKLFPKAALPTIDEILVTPFKRTIIGRLDGSLAINTSFTKANIAGSPLNVADQQYITIEDIDDQNIFTVDIVVLPDTQLNNNAQDNYYSIFYDGVERKYYLDSFTGIPIINTQTIHLENSIDLDQLKIQPQPGILLEYKITYTFPKP